MAIPIRGLVRVEGDIVTRRVAVGGMVAAAYASGDVVGIPFTIPNVVRRHGRGGLIQSVTLIESTIQGVNAEVWLFDRMITSAADNAAHSISDADALFAIDAIPLTSHYASALNSVSVARAVGRAFQCKADSSDLVGLLVTRGAPTYAADGIVLKFDFIQE